MAEDWKQFMSLKKKTLRNLGTFTVAQLVSMVVTQLAVLFLAKMIDPANFGIYSLLSVIYTFASNTSTAGIDYAAIQSKDDEESVLTTSSTLRMIGTLVAIVALVAFSPLISTFFGQPEMVIPLVILAVSLFIPALSFMSQIMLNRALRFPQISASKIGYAFTWAAVALAVATYYPSYWALVIALVCANVCASAILVHFAPRRVFFRFDRLVSAKLIKFAKYPMMAGLISFAFFNFDKFIIGSVAGEALLGAYFLAFTWGTMIPNIFTNIVSNVMLPTYVQLNGDRKALADTYLKTMEYLSYLSAPMGFGIASISSMFVVAVLGTEWMAAIFPLAILSFVGLLLSITSPAGTIFLATGNPSRTWRMVVIMYIPGVTLMIPAAIYFGINGVAITMLAISAVASIWILKMATDILGEPMSSVGRVVWRPFVAASFMMAAIILLSAILTPGLPELMISILFGALVYLLMVIALTKGKIVGEARSLIKTMISK